MALSVVLVPSSTLGGIDLEVLCASPFWNHGVADEVGEHVRTWLEDSLDGIAR